VSESECFLFPKSDSRGAEVVAEDPFPTLVDIGCLLRDVKEAMADDGE
jgi:hypothetical protein